MNQFIDLFITFFKIGAFTLGGGFAMLPLIEREVVDKKEWIGKEEMVDVLALSQSIPGGIAINASIIVGYKIRGIIGALISTIGIALPSFISILLIAILLTRIGSLAAVEAAFKGVRATVVALVGIAAYSFGKVIIKDYGTFIIFIVSLIVLIWGKISSIWVIVLGALVGYAITWAIDKWKETRS